MNYQLTSSYQPTGDQPEAIRQLTDGLKRGDKAQVLLGVTGSGKTFTVANVIANAGKPTLILSHNKTLAAQLYEEPGHQRGDRPSATACGKCFDVRKKRRHRYIFCFVYIRYGKPYGAQ